MATLKQKIAFKEIIEKHRPVSTVMREVGYSPNTAKMPYNLTKSKGWKELMNEALPDDKLFKVHNEALEATKVVSARVTGKDADSQTDDFIDVPDHPTRLRAVELGYRLKGKLNNDSGINIDKANILVMPSELIEKYEISSDTINSSK